MNNQVKTCSNNSCVRHEKCDRFVSKVEGKGHTHIEPDDNSEKNFKCRYFIEK